MQSSRLHPQAAATGTVSRKLGKNLNEYVAALIALKQKIIDTDHLLTEYQQKCNELQFAKRENNTLHQQVEQMFQKLSPLKKCEEELGTVKAELEEKKSSLKIYQETHLEYIRVKDEMDKSDIVKKKLETKVKKLEEAAAKHIQEFKQLKAEKKVLEKELKKAQEKIEGFPNTKQKKVLKNAETQSERENPVANLDKEKIKLLLDELWTCIDGSTGKHQRNKNDYILEAVQNPQKFKKRRREKPPSSSSPETCAAQTSLASLQITLDSRTASYDGPVGGQAMDMTDVFDSDSEGGSVEVIAQTDVAACDMALFSKEQEELGENLRDVLKWGRPLPPLLSPIQFSPAATPDMLFGDLTDSSDDETDRNAQMLENIIEECGRDGPAVETLHETHSAESLNKCRLFSVDGTNSDSQESPEKLGQLSNGESVLRPDSGTPKSRCHDEGDATSEVEERHLEENSDCMEAPPTAEIACGAEHFVMTEAKDGLLTPHLMSIAVQDQEKPTEPVHMQKIVSNDVLQVLEEANDGLKEEDQEELTGTTEDWLQTPNGSSRQHSEEFVLATENVLVAPEKCFDGSSDVIERGGVVKDATADIQTPPDLGRPRPLDEEHGDHASSEGLCTGRNNKPSVEEKMNVDNDKFFSQTEHPNEQVLQQGSEVTFAQPIEMVIPAPDASVERPRVEEKDRSEEKCSKQQEAEMNAENEPLNVDPHLHITVATNEGKKSLCHVEEIIEGKNECSTAPVRYVKNGDDDQPKMDCSMMDEPTSGDISKKDCLQIEQFIDQKDSIQLLQEEPVLPAQVSVIKECLLLSERPVETNNAIPGSTDDTGHASDPGHVAAVGAESECKSQLHSMSGSFPFAEASKDDQSLRAEGLEEDSKQLKIAETRSVQLLITGKSEKAPPSGTVCNRNAESSLITGNTQCGINGTAQEMAEWNDKSRSSDLGESVAEEANYECSVANEMASELNMSEGLAQSMSTHNTEPRSIGSKPSIASVDVPASKPGVDFEVCSSDSHCSDTAAKGLFSAPVCIAPSSPKRSSAEQGSLQSLDCRSPDSKNEVEIEQAGEPAVFSKTEVPVQVEGSCSGDSSEALTLETFTRYSVNTVDFCTADKCILDDKEPPIPPDHQLSSPSESCAAEAIIKGTDEITSSGSRSEGGDEMKIPESAVTGTNLSVSDSAKEEMCLIQKVNCAELQPCLAVPNDDLATSRSSCAGAASGMALACVDGHELPPGAEGASSEGRQAAMQDNDSRTGGIVEKAGERSCATGWARGTENTSLQSEVSIAVGMPEERQAEQSMPAVASSPGMVPVQPPSGQSSPSSPHGNGDSVAPDTRCFRTGVEFLGGWSDVSKGELSAEQEKSNTVSGDSANSEQSHLTPCHVDTGSDAGHNEECHVKTDGQSLAAEVSCISVPCVLENSNSGCKEQNTSEELKSPVVVSLCAENGADQDLKPPDPINISAQVGVKGGHKRLLPRMPCHKGERKSRHTLLTEIILASADASTPTKHYPKILKRIRQEMGPPLPPLLTPLIATPPRTVRPISPVMPTSSQTSLPPSLDEPISPLCEAPLPPHTSPLSETPKCTSPAPSATPPPFETSVGQRILSSPLQFCAATPKHALPVPGRLPPSAGGAAAPPLPQENSVKILDSMYPELSARARTLNILKGNIQLGRSSSLDGKSIPKPVHQISGFKAITSSSTAFVKTGMKFSSDPEQPFSVVSETGKRKLAPVVQPKSTKRPRPDGRAPKSDPCKEELSAGVSDPHVCFPAVETVDPNNGGVTQPTGDCASELLLAVDNEGDPDSRSVAVALEKVSEACFDLLPVIRSHILVGNTSGVPVMRDEEKEVVHEFGVTKKHLAEPALQAILDKLKRQRRSLAHNCIQSLCRVYVGICRQLGDLEKARLFCYTLLKEDFPRFDKLTVFIGNMWSEIFCSESVVNKAVQLVARQRARGEVLKCLRTYLNWEENAPAEISVMISSLLLAIRLCPQMEFQHSEHCGEDLKEATWEYVFAIDLLCTHQKWCWTHDNIISKELWPIMDKWMKNRKAPGSASYPSDIIVATVLRLIGRLGQMGLREGFFPAVENISSVIGTFLQHSKEKDVAWGVQLAAAYALCDLSPSNPPRILESIRVWEAACTSPIPPALASSIAEASSLLTCRQAESDSSSV
ncbi:little elongation complex subunit 1 isoform X2 [Varanus komodoensis]|uniref:little elongation complex subunit 1 isoform X2 n=1 Tax=Varanus komodoensis TaxID=61221 RepID=UPI001CF7E5F1|nr:little elongation complex subunit 1 isoform X2 [Varanus komodoensis]